MTFPGYQFPSLAKPFPLSGRNVGAHCRRMLLTVALTCAPFSATTAQDAQSTDDKLPEVTIWRSGSGYITEGQDAVFYVAADPVPAEELTVNLLVAQFRESWVQDVDFPGFGDIEDIDRTEVIQQITIDSTGESRISVSTEDDNQNNPKYVIHVSIAPGEGYTRFESCMQNRCIISSNIYGDPGLLAFADFARFSVWDNDGPQSELKNIVTDTEKLLENVTIDIPTAADATEFGVLSELSAAAAPDLVEGGAYNSDAFLLLKSVRMQAEILERMISSGFTISKEAIWSTIRNATSSIDSYNQTEIDFSWLRYGGHRKFDGEVRDFLAGSRNLFSALVATQGESASIQETAIYLEEIESLIDTAFSGVLNVDTQHDVAGISQVALDGLMKPLAEKFDIDLSQKSKRDLFNSNPDFLANIVEITGLDLSSDKLSLRSSGRSSNDSPIVITSNDVSSRLLILNALRFAGLQDSEAANLTSDLSSFVHPGFTGISVPIPGDVYITATSIVDDPNEHYLDHKFVSVSEIIDEGLGGATESKYIDEFFVTAIRIGELVFATQVTSVKVVSEDVPEGRFSLNDGSILLINRGLAIHLVPWSLDIASFAVQASALGFSTRGRENGAILLAGRETGISATFSYTASPMEIAEDEAASFGVCLYAVCIDAPENTGPEQPDHSFTIGYTPIYFSPYNAFRGPVEHYDFGANRFFTSKEECEAEFDTCQVDWQQRLLPRFASDSLYDLLASLGLEVSTDWFDTGVITIAGRGRFRPAYAFEGELPDESAIGPDDFRFEETDANGDGVLDYRVHIGDFSQLLYGVP